MKVPRRAGEGASQPNLPAVLASARTDLWDDSPIWTEADAISDYETLFRVGDLDKDANTFDLWSRLFPGVGSWEFVGRFPGHYVEHFVLCHFIHAWCRDVLVLGEWHCLKGVGGELGGETLMESSMRMMRYLSRLRTAFLRDVEEYRADNGDLAFSLKYRIPTMDLHMLALFFGCKFSQYDYCKFLKGEKNQRLFRADPLKLGMFCVTFLRSHSEFMQYCRLAWLAASQNS
jgi:hypothetical protein